MLGHPFVHNFYSSERPHTKILTDVNEDDEKYGMNFSVYVPIIMIISYKARWSAFINQS